MAGAMPRTTLHAGQLWHVSWHESMQKANGAQGQQPMRQRPPQISQVSRPGCIDTVVETVARLSGGEGRA